jgi:Putative inner membrane protein (DUF1819)
MIVHMGCNTTSAIQTGITSSKRTHMAGQDYRMSFGTGGLYVIEARKLLAMYQDLKSWNEVIELAVTENLLQFKSSASTRRAVREIVTRLRNLSHSEIDFYLAADPSDQAVLAWLAVCRTYKFVADFIDQVVREAFSSYRFELGLSAFDIFFEDQKSDHPELDGITENTRRKLRQILFRMMREAGILTKQGQITGCRPSARLALLLDKEKVEYANYLTGVYK